MMDRTINSAVTSDVRRFGQHSKRLPVLLFGVGLILSFLLWMVLNESEQRQRSATIETETAALERTLRGALDERARALMRTAQRWQLAGGRTRTEFDLEAEVNRQSYPSFRSLGWVGPDLVVRWVYPQRENARAVGLNNGSDPIRGRALHRAARTGGPVLAGPVDLIQGGRGLILFQSIGTAGGQAQGFVYAAIAPESLLARELGDVGPGYAIRVSVGGESVFVRQSRTGLRPAGAPSDVQRFSFGGSEWRLETWAPHPPVLRLSTVVPLLGVLAFAALAAVARGSLRAQSRASAAQRELATGEARFRLELERTELKLARESEDRVRRVLDQLFAFVGITDLDGILLEANRAPLQAAGLTAQEVLGRPLWDAYWWSHDPAVQAQLRDAVTRAAAGDVVRYDALVRLANGAIATIDFQIAPLRDANGAITHLVPSATVVEERVRAQAELRQRIAQLRSVYNGVPVGLAFHDRELRFLEVNDYLAAINGRPVSDHVGRTIAEVLPEIAGDLVPLMRRVIDSGEPIIGAEMRVHRPGSGAERDYLLSYTPARDGQGEVIGLTVAIVDITDQKAAETAIRESELRYTTLIRSIDAGFSLLEIIFDGESPRDYRFVEVNPAFERQTGLHDVTGKAVSEIIPDLEKHWVEIYGRVALTGEPARFENESRALDRWYDVYAVPVGDRSPYRVGVLFNDISARRRAEEEVRELNRELETRVEARTRELASANEELNAFAYTVSHDLRAPLRAMEGFARILLEDYGDSFDEEGRRYATRIVAAATRMEGLIHDLLEYSRLSRAELRLRPVDLGPVVRRCIEDARASFADARIETEGKLPVVMGDAAVLSQIICNLVGNAAKFTRPGDPARVLLYAEDCGATARLWVEDQGIGIAPEHQDRIWLVFERLHGQEAYPGTGVGLGVVRRGVERLGGTCGLISEPGRGSRFWIELEIAESTDV